MSPVLHFTRHYVEMVIAMFAGMLVLGAPAVLALGAVGVDLLDDAPGLYLLGMGVTMTVPMVALMAYRGHGRRANTEMALSMMVPTVAVMALLGADVLGDVHDAMMVQHVVMFPAMLGAMLLRPSEYAGGAHEQVTS